MKVAVLGSGAWGTALARLLSEGGHAITLWGHNAEHLAEMQHAGRNEKYLPGIELPRNWRYEASLPAVIAEQEYVVLAVPSRAFRQVSEALANFSGIVVSVTKGIECETGLTMSGILEITAPKAQIAALSGPTLALEIARGNPAAGVAASAESAAAKQVQKLFHRPTFRVYTSSDLIGVELGGALKNVIAIAAGVSDGVGFGDNSKAGLITRGIAEMRRLGVACGAKADTFSGLSGLGDLSVTCFSKLSRNRMFGERLGRGEKVDAILANTITVAEGYPTARSARQLGRKFNIETPIIDEVYAMLYEGKKLAPALKDLMGRDSKAEN